MFSEERAEAIAKGYREQIRLGLKTREEVFKEVEGIYRPDMQEAIKKRLEEEVEVKISEEVREKAKKLVERMYRAAGLEVPVDVVPRHEEEEYRKKGYRVEQTALYGEIWYLIYPPKSSTHGEERVDARFEEARKTKVEEWRGKGYSEKLINRALMWADSWARGIAEIAKVDPAVIYQKALDAADTWLEEVVKAMV